MYKATIKLPTMASAVILLWSLVGYGADDNRLSKAFQNARQTGDKNIYTLLKEKASGKVKSAEQLFKELKDEDVLIKIGNADVLKWGVIRRHVEALCLGIGYRPEMQAEGNEALKSIAFQSRLRKLLKEYVEHSVFAVEARRNGITVDDETFNKYRAMARAGYAKMGEAGKALLGLMSEKECFYEQNLTNALYWQAYKNKFLAPIAEAEEGDVEKMIGMVHAANAAATATNLHNRAFISEIQEKLKGGLEFGDAAEKWSDCESSATRGVMMDGMDEHPERFASGDLPEPIEAVLEKLKEGETSGVIETPAAWHIVRLLKRNAATEQDEQTVEIAQIMIEKKMLEPELTSKQARAKVEAIKMKAVLKVKFRELLDTVKIDSKIPLWESADPNKRAVKVRRIK